MSVNQYLYGLIILLLLNPVLAIDINTATATELAHELNGVGTVKSKLIVEHREKIGSFVAAEQLLEIKGIGQKILQKNRDKIQIGNVPSIAKPDLKPLNIPVKILFWDSLIIIFLSLICLAIFISAWLIATKKDKAILREHLITTTFTCSNCGKVSALKNIYYEGHIQNQYIDGSLPPGWSSIPNSFGELCDYCFNCSQQST